jgi:UDP-N-acetylglucosamine 2-epimerase (non-hydrolysing)
MLITFIGTRAQLIKMAPVLLLIEEGGLPHHLVFTGQHKETMTQLLADFGIKTRPVYLYEGREITGIFQMLRWFIRCLYRLFTHPDRYLPTLPGQKNIIIVHGDTFSTLLGAIAGRMRKMDVAHVEAGLRSYNLFHPFPEELTRIAIFRLAHYAFCPGDWAYNNMDKYPLQRINTGENTLLDAVKIALRQQIAQSHRFSGGSYGVCSIHRFENIFRKHRLLTIIQLLEQAALLHPMLFVLHPATRKRLNDYGLMARLESNPRIQLLPRMGYIQFLHLIKDAVFVVTDGGGNQEELSYLAKPTLLMRKATERKEGLGTTAVLCNYDTAILSDFLAKLPQQPSATVQLAGDAPSRVIYSNLKSYLLD